MSIFHFRGVLIRADGDWYEYEYYPDHVMAESVTGRFKVNSSTWESVVLSEAGAEEKGLVSTDEQCVSGLVDEIEKLHDESGEMPNDVCRIS